MKTIRLMIATVACVAFAFALAQACGGQFTVGYDDAGSYHTPEGGVLKVGGACADFDASHYFNDGGFNCELGTDQCQQWLVPPGWFWNYVCVPSAILDDAGNEIVDDGGHTIVATDAGHCTNSSHATGAPPACDPHLDESENFCTAWFEQFITHGDVEGTCRLPGGPGTCRFKSQSTIPNCDLAVIRLDPDGGMACVPPCAP